MRSTRKAIRRASSSCSTAAAASASPVRGGRVDEQRQRHSLDLHPVGSLNGGPGSAGAIEAGDEEVAVAGAVRCRGSKQRRAKPPFAAAAGAPRRRTAGAGARIRYPPGRSTRAISAGHGRAVRSDDQVEEFVGEGKAARPGLLEGDPALRVEADPGAAPRERAPASGRRRAPAPRELAGKEEAALAVAAADHQRPLGRRDVKHRGGERGQRWGAHAAMIASPGPADSIL